VQRGACARQHATAAVAAVGQPLVRCADALGVIVRAVVAGTAAGSGRRVTAEQRRALAPCRARCAPPQPRGLVVLGRGVARDRELAGSAATTVVAFATPTALGGGERRRAGVRGVVRAVALIARTATAAPLRDVDDDEIDDVELRSERRDDDDEDDNDEAREMTRGACGA